MAHKHDGTVYYILVSNKTGDALYDSWADILTFNTEDEAKEFQEDMEYQDDYHIETWIDW